jgi:peptidoglycan/LPS O-acetylase OafA/YrhL
MENGADKSFGTYIGRRFFRIYPIFLLALATSYALATGWSLDLSTMVGNLLMLQDFTNGKPGVLFGTFAGNVPLWSLSYEWWFYLMFFPLYSYVPDRMQMLAVTTAGVFAATLYNFLHFQPLLFIAYFPIWWSGVEIGRAIAHHTHIPVLRVVASLGALCATFALFVVLFWEEGHRLSLGIHPFLEFRHAAAALTFVTCLFIYRRYNTRADFLWNLRVALPHIKQCWHSRSAGRSSDSRDHLHCIGSRMVR